MTLSEDMVAEAYASLDLLPSDMVWERVETMRADRHRLTGEVETDLAVLLSLCQARDCWAETAPTYRDQKPRPFCWKHRNGA